MPSVGKYLEGVDMYHGGEGDGIVPDADAVSAAVSGPYRSLEADNGRPAG